jgi:hypothetical protein
MIRIRTATRKDLLAEIVRRCARVALMDVKQARERNDASPCVQRRVRKACAKGDDRRGPYASR